MEYKIKHIDEICNKITDGSHFSPENCENGNYKMYSVKDMEYNGFNDSECKYIDDEMFNKLSKADCRPLKDDILIAKDGSYLKHVFRVKEDMDACILSSIAILRVNKEDLNLDYIVYLMRSKTMRNAMSAFVSGSALPRIILSDFKKMKIKIIADKEIQNKISEILIEYDNLIENNNKRISILEQMAEEIYKEWFVRFRFPEFKSYKFIEEKPYGWIYGNKSNMKIPSNWHFGKLNEIGQFIRGKNITSAEMQEGEVPVISAGIEPSGYHNEANVKGKSLTMSASGANAGYLKYNLNDIWAADCSYYQNDENIWFVYSSLKFIESAIKNLQVGSAQPHVYTKNINKLNIIIPEEKYKKMYNDLVNPMFEEIRILNEKNKILEKQRDLLLPRLMSGKLEVK